ncbi:MAG: 4-hydroxy-3-methylbut-2-enyl diphosphate reductase [Lachnospiraceae bacterium]|nr:4-hydroxy-3-methylbut-2-enyl diphosphate reductase [Lachnospiraceae bacterium]
MSYQIAIDGPAGAGKSTIAKRVAKKLDYIYVDTGAMYRAMALYFVKNKIDIYDELAVNEACQDIDIAIKYENDVQQVYLNGENVTAFLRTEEVGNTASVTSAYKKVREKLVELQRKLGKTNNVVMDGRDIGTHVLVDADVKVYLTASVEARAQRRYKELLEKNEECNLEDIKADIEDRDYRDMNREISPLRQAEDAILVDSSDMTIEEVTDKIIRLTKVRLTKTAGFCFGVKRAVDIAYENGKENTVYTLGPIIHNEEVVKDLEKNNVFTINTLEELDKIQKGATIIIRSHGVSRKIHQMLEEKGYNVIDATCPFVKKIHKIVDEESKSGATIVIIGNDGHPEVEGIKGWSNTDTFVVDSEESINKLSIDKQKKICIVSQTTFNYKKFEDLVEIFVKKGYNSSVRNTICNATEERQKEAKEIAKAVDAMIVIGSNSSSNTRKLYEICKSECDNTAYIQTCNDLDMSLYEESNSIGITAGASTPKNIIEEVHTNVRIKF